MTAQKKKSVRGSRSGRPIMVLLDALGQRWALRVLWELRAKRLSFRSLRTACGEISPTVLNVRLRHLRDLGLVALHEEGYGLTREGEALGQHFMALDAWANDWAKARGSAGD
ncbi:MAG: helix-turn-helix transcriptional regulator [Alphaproteobacteria bacterium]|nr:helix-turn-helix transcriptional regulator [Alphaproteobacteria bacterium]